MTTSSPKIGMKKRIPSTIRQRNLSPELIIQVNGKELGRMGRSWTDPKRRMDDAIAKGKAKFEADNAESIEYEIESARSSEEASAIDIKDVSQTEHSRLRILKDKQVIRLKEEEDEREKKKQEERQSFAMSKIEGLISTYKVEELIENAASKGEKSCMVGMPFWFEIDDEQNYLVSGDPWSWNDPLVTTHSGHEISAGVFRSLFEKIMEDRGKEQNLKATFLENIEIDGKWLDRSGLNHPSVKHSNYRGLAKDRQGKLSKCEKHGGWIYYSNETCSKRGSRRWFNNCRYWKGYGTIPCLKIKWE